MDINLKTQQEETKSYLFQGKEADEKLKEKYLKKALDKNYFITKSIKDDDLKKFRWNESILGEVITNREEAVAKGVRYTYWNDVARYWMASSTIGIPKREPARTSYAVGSKLNELVKSKATQDVEHLISSVSFKSYRELASFYGVTEKSSLCLFDDNATMAIYQFLGLLNLDKDMSVISFFDTGRVMPDALKGLNPEMKKDNFKPNVDAWDNNSHEGKIEKIGDFNLHLVEHYVNDIYRSNLEIIDEVLTIVRKNKPKVVIIPSVTRVGRRLPFITLCKEVRRVSNDLGVDPIIIIDDAQGMGRLARSRYFSETSFGWTNSTSNIWDYADGVFITGAKVLGALMGAGAILFKEDRFKKFRVKKLKDAPLASRMRRYALISQSSSLVKEANSVAPGIVNTIELASFCVALKESQDAIDGVDAKMRKVRKKIVSELESFKDLKVLKRINGEVKFIDSIVAFYLIDRPDGGKRLKEILAEKHNVTIPAIVRADSRDYLRFAIDPVALYNETDYEERVDYAITSLKKAIKQLEGEMEKNN